MKKDRTGKVHINKVGESCEIIESNGWDDCTIRYSDGTIVKNVCYANIKKGEVKNPNTPSIKGIGYPGQGRFERFENGLRTVAYNKFLNMMDRCYESGERHLAYQICSVDPRWHNFQNFALWMEENYRNYMQDWHLDKDIIIKGNKVYSSETCMLVPREINNLFPNRSSKRGKYPLGVYKEKSKYVARTSINKIPTFIGRFDTPEEAFNAYKGAKEGYIRNIADRWKALLPTANYKYIINYEIEITD